MDNRTSAVLNIL